MAMPAKIRPLLTDLGVFGKIDDKTCIVIPKTRIIYQEQRTMTHKTSGTYNANLLLISRTTFIKSLNQAKVSYRTHKYSVESSTRPQKYPKYSKTHIMCPWNHLTHIQENHKGIIIAFCHKI